MSLHIGLLKKFVLPIAFLMSCIAISSSAEDVKTINPKITYILDGQIIPGWGMQLGDPENWSVAVTDRNGKSASGKLSVEPSDFKATGDAIKLTWAPRKQVKATFALYGSALDLSSFENNGALVLDIKINVSPDKDVTLGMDCGHPCRGELHVRKNLADLKKGEWISLPIALNCFSKEGLDLKKVYGPIVIGTDGKLTMEIASVRLLRLKDGDKGCAE